MLLPFFGMVVVVGVLVTHFGLPEWGIHNGVNTRPQLAPSKRNNRFTQQLRGQRRLLEHCAG